MNGATWRDVEYGERQLIEAASDGGVSWQVVFDATYVPRAETE